GIQSPQASWGNIIYAAQNLVVLTKRWWVWVPAGVLLMITIICINLVGEGIRDALDPKMKR
ncbi:MAG: ABC transporter permease, partial [Lachnospiraceae bacterium]|nr:ABC transporter permease [Lachnospiraceae bacterium]